MIEIQTLAADPPWPFGDDLSRKVKNRGAAKHYKTLALEIIPLALTMALEQINTRPGQELVSLADNAHCYLWIPNSFLLEGAHIPILQAWGFVPKQILTWVKPELGMGHWYRNTTEQIVFAVRGNLPPLRKDQRTHFGAHRPRRHSEKPDRFFQVVESMSPGPRLELFARKSRTGWYGWGDQLEAA